jgi:hypothetical protein
MLRVIFTLDYEIHGNGDGSPYELMVKPTDRLLRLFDRYGAKLTIMADIAEILKFKEYKEEHGRDDFSYDAIIDQLRRAVKGGHDVQLHLHTSFFNARYDKRRWLQDWSEYDFANLPFDRMDWMVRTGKEFLETIIKPVNPDYRCIAFRAANWSVSPSRNVVRALIENDIKIDTSVFKGGRRTGIVNFDYTSAHHSFLPWPADPDNICRFDATSPVWEFPIYSENRWVGAFLTPNRIYRVILGRQHKVANNFSTRIKSKADMSRRSNPLSLFLREHAWKADFNQCSSRQLIKALILAMKEVHSAYNMPFVLIGHSKLFNRLNEIGIRSFLIFVRSNPSKADFGTLADFS